MVSKYQCLVLICESYNIRVEHYFINQALNEILIIFDMKLL